MKLSDRIMKIKPSPTLTVTAMANSMKAQGIDVIGFGSGEPDFDTPQPVKDAAVKALNDGKTKYTPVGGIPELKEGIVTKFKRDNGLEYKTAEVTVNCGGKHSFYNLMQVLLNDGDEVIIPAPYWVSYPSIVLLAGGKPVIIETTESGEFKITPDQLKEAITGKTRAVVLNSPSNPTGAAYDTSEIEKLAGVLAGKEILIVTDDIYESIVYDGFTFSNIANVSDEMKKQTIVLNGVSKTYSMTGWRIGYMAGDETVIKKVETLQSQSTSNPTSISQWAALEAITGDQSVVNEMLTAFARRRDLITGLLREIPGVTCFNPNGAFYVFPGIEGIFSLKGWKKAAEKYNEEYNSTALSSYLLEEAKVAVVPGIAFGSDNHMRLSYAASDETIQEGIIRIKAAVEKLA